MQNGESSQPPEHPRTAQVYRRETRSGDVTIPCCPFNSVPRKQPRQALSRLLLLLPSPSTTGGGAPTDSHCYRPPYTLSEPSSFHKWKLCSQQTYLQVPTEDTCLKVAVWGGEGGLHAYDTLYHYTQGSNRRCANIHPPTPFPATMNFAYTATSASQMHRQKKQTTSSSGPPLTKRDK